MSVNKEIALFFGYFEQLKNIHTSIRDVIGPRKSGISQPEWFSNLLVSLRRGRKPDMSQPKARPSHSEIGQHCIIIGPEQGLMPV